MQNRALTYFRKEQARKIIESPLEVDLQTLLSANFALSHNRVVKKHIHNTLVELNTNYYKLSA